MNESVYELPFSDGIADKVARSGKRRCSNLASLSEANREKNRAKSAVFK